MKWVTTALLLAALIGCTANQANSGGRSINYTLPTAAKNVREVGNLWYVFDMDFNGRTRTFLFNHTTQSVTELSP